MPFAILNPGIQAAIQLPAAAVPAAPPTDATPGAVLPLPDLEDLALAAPLPLPLRDLAERIGVSFDLLDRIARRRQPLPGWLVGPIAEALGVDPAEVRGAAGEVLEARVRLGIAENPLPPERAFGEPIYPIPIRPTSPVVFPGA